MDLERNHYLKTKVISIFKSLFENALNQVNDRRLKVIYQDCDGN